jgi:hypothetical protein
MSAFSADALANYARHREHLLVDILQSIDSLFKVDVLGRKLSLKVPNTVALSVSISVGEPLDHDEVDG